MTPTRRQVPALVALALAACASLLCASLLCARPASAAPAAYRSPLPLSQYAIRGACSSPLPAHAACMASELVPTSAEARAHLHPLGLPLIVQPQVPSAAAGDYGLRPKDLHSAYSLPLSPPSEQTIAIVDAYNDPAAEADLRTFDEEFKLPPCTAASGCLQQLNEHGQRTGLPFPKSTSELNAERTTNPELAEEATGWGLEISLDIQTVHAVCQSCHILLLEASSPLDSDLETAETTAEALGAQEISNSWGGSENGETEAGEREGPFDHPGTVITASAGDYGYLDWDTHGAKAVEFPAASPHVVAVGGTRLQLTEKHTWLSESVWNGLGAGGGGCSTVFKAPAWQTELSDWSGVGCSEGRAVADIAADADPYTGVAVEDSLYPKCKHTYTEGGKTYVQHWCTLGGTSLASPLIAATFALAGGSHGVDYPAETLYESAAEKPESLHDVTSGSNGECTQPYNSFGESGCPALQEAGACSSDSICLAGSGYDGPTGLGTPDGTAAFRPTGGGEESVKGGEEDNEAGEEPPSPEGGSPPGESPSGAGGGSPNPGAGGGSTEAPDGSAGASDPEEEESEEGAEDQNVISALALLPASGQAAQSSHHKLAQLQFKFLASVATRVHVSLARQVVARRHTHWHTLHASARLSALRGHNTGRLTTGQLATGTYRLTLTPRTGAARSLIFHVR